MNSKKNGKGKEYDEKGKLIFEVEYLNGLKNGKILHIIKKINGYLIDVFSTKKVLNYMKIYVLIFIYLKENI